jgi:hypothetical protein
MKNWRRGMAKPIMPNGPSGFDANKSRKALLFIPRKLLQMHKIKTSFIGAVEENSTRQVVIHPRIQTKSE